MSYFNGTAKLVHSTELPAGATAAQGVAMLRDYEFFLQCDPHMAKFEPLEDEGGSPLPDAVEALSATRSFRVTDVVHTLPAGLWDSNVVSTYEFTDIARGVFVRIRSPLGVVMDTVWEIREGDKRELVEDIFISCSRLLIGVVKAQCEGGWQKIHDKMMGRLGESPGQ